MRLKLTSVDASFKNAQKRFETAAIESARIDARLLLGHVLGGGAERVLSQSGRDLSIEEFRAFEGLVKRRETHEPISQILGVREFWSLPFKVTSATLTPRPDTETIVETALDYVIDAPQHILDLGTGTGCILLALLSEWKNAQGVGVDASHLALAVAQENAQALNMADRATFVVADWRMDNGFVNLAGPFDLVVSNPPYIPAADIAGLDADVRDFEPVMALSGGPDGLEAYREIIVELPNVLARGGIVVFEVGLHQGSDVAKMLIDAGFHRLEKRRDLSGIVRAVVAQRR